MKLYAWTPNGFGELSWYVMAENEEDAMKSVEAEMARLMAIRGDYESDECGISEYDIRGWGTDYYTLTVHDVGCPVYNHND